MRKPVVNLVICVLLRLVQGGAFTVDLRLLDCLEEYLSLRNPLLLCDHRKKMDLRSSFLETTQTIPIHRRIFESRGVFRESLVICLHKMPPHQFEQIYYQTNRFQPSANKTWLFLYSNNLSINTPMIRQLRIDINRKAYFLETTAMKLFELYTINQVKVWRNLGEFTSNTSFVPLVLENFLSRRSNFHGLPLRIILEVQKPYLMFANLTIPEKIFPDQVFLASLVEGKVLD